MKTKIKCILALALLWAARGEAQEYYRATQQAPVNGQPYYILPKALINLSIQVASTTYGRPKQGMRNFEAEELKILQQNYGVDPSVYLKLTQLAGDKTSYSVYKIMEDSIRISMGSRPDYNKIFYTDSRKSWNKNKSIVLSYGEDGIATDGESMTENKTFDLILKGVSSLSTVAGAFRGGKSINPEAAKKLAFDDLDKVIEAMQDLKNSPSNYDIYKDLKAGLEKKYSKLFSEYFYTEKKDIKKTSAVFEPSSSVPGTAFDFFGFDDQTGEIDFSNQLPGSFWASDKTPKSLTKNIYKLQFFKVTDNIESYISKTPNQNEGFAYNIPAKIELKLTSSKETICDIFVKIPQLGIIGYIASAKKKLSYTLDPLTGELKKLSLSSNALSSDQIAATANSSTDLIKALKGESSATKLESEVKRLENEKKKRDLLKELEQ